MTYSPKDATPTTAGVLDAARARYALDDRADYEDAVRGKIADIPGRRVVNDAGQATLDLAELDFLGDDDAAPPGTVDASLWRQSQLMRHGGLFRVVDRLYQVRNSDIADVTFVEGDDGVVVIDCSSSVEAARQALDLLRAHVTDKPVVAVIYTHTHIDHYGGVKGVVDPADVASGRCRSSRRGRSRRSTRSRSGRTSSRATRCRAAPGTPSSRCSTGVPAGPSPRASA